MGQEALDAPFLRKVTKECSFYESATQYLVEGLVLQGFYKNCAGFF